MSKRFVIERSDLFQGENRHCNIAKLLKFIICLIEFLQFFLPTIIHTEIYRGGKLVKGNDYAATTTIIIPEKNKIIAHVRLKRNHKKNGYSRMNKI